MNISGTSGSGYVRYLSRSNATAPSSRVAAAATDRRVTSGQRAELGRLLKHLDALEKNLKIASRPSVAGSVVGSVDGSAGGGQPSAPPLVSSDPFTLGAATPARLASTGRIGASGTSVTPREPAWDQATDARLRVVGVYDGSDGEGTIEFTAEGSRFFPNYSSVRVRAKAPDGSVIGVFDFAKSDPPNTVRSLGNGLSFSLEPSGNYPATGSATRVDVATGGVNVDNPFDGIGSAGPDFEGGAAVTAGSFTLDGTVIDVRADDSVNDVLAKINASAADVTATFDASSETVEIVRNAAGASPAIALSNDSSGFLDAVRLDPASSAPGHDRGEDRPIGEIAPFEAVSSGTLTINGRAVAIDVGADSLRDVIDAINAAGADVTASLGSSGGQSTLELAATTPQLTLDGGGTGFFAALGITESSYGAPASEGSGGADADAQALAGRALRLRSYRAADALEDVRDTLEKLFSDGASGALGPLQGAVAELLQNAADKHGEQRLGRLGLELVAGEDGFFRAGRRARGRFVDALQSPKRPLEKVLLGARGSGKEGLIEALRELVGDYLKGGGSDPRGLLVDVKV